MPMEQKGFLFRFFDKVIAGVVLLALVATLLVATSRRSSLSTALDVQDMERQLSTLRQKMGSQPPPMGTPDYLAKFQKRLGSPATPLPVRPFVFYWPPPREYIPERVGVDREFVLTFDAPLLEGSIEIEGADYLVRDLKHPVEDRYDQVWIKTSPRPGSFTVVGEAGDVSHIYRVVVDKEISKTAYAPVDLKVTDNQGTAMLQFKPDPRIAGEAVQIDYYEVYRRDWRDPLGDYVRAGNTREGVRKKRQQRRSREQEMMELYEEGLLSPEDMQDMFGDGSDSGGTRRPAAKEQAAQEVFAWEDDDAVPGSNYSYKIRAVGTNTYPSAGEFGEPLRVKVLPDVDFMFAGHSGAGGDLKVRFEVVKASATGRRSLTREPFFVGFADEIGGVIPGRTDDTAENLLTGATLVDHHTGIRGRKRYTDRIIYADENGNLHQRLKRERASKLWERAAPRQRDRRVRRRTSGGRR